MSQANIGVIGAGAWGTALARLLAVEGHAVSLWVFEKPVFEEILKDGVNHTFLPDIQLPANLRPTQDLAECVTGKDLILIVCPSHVMRMVMGQAAPHIDSRTILVSCAKGIENGTLLMMSEVIQDVLPDRLDARFCTLSGPTFAREVAQGLPAAAVVAADDHAVAVEAQRIINARHFRTYTSHDIIGAEIGGAIKNVIAIGAGAADGMRLGNNARAGMITRGLSEMARLGVAKGADPLTFLGLAGVGDLFLTCTGDLSRNRTVGKQLGEGNDISVILGSMKNVAEGVKTSQSVYELSTKLGVEMPICHAVYRTLHEGWSAQRAMQELLEREVSDEMQGIWQAVPGNRKDN